MSTPKPQADENLDDLFANATESEATVELPVIAEPAHAVDHDLAGLFPNTPKATGKARIAVLDDDELEAVFGKSLFKPR